MLLHLAQCAWDTLWIQHDVAQEKSFTNFEWISNEQIVSIGGVKIQRTVARHSLSDCDV